jgi:hypothetical protein
MVDNCVSLRKINILIIINSKIVTLQIFKKFIQIFGNRQPGLYDRRFQPANPIADFDCRAARFF